MSLDVFHVHNYAVYLITPLYRGGELNERVDRDGPYCEDDATGLISSVVSAIACIHAHGVVHRDIKPENLLFQSLDPGAKLILVDFGLAEFIDDAPTRLVELCGTPGYIAPEMMQRSGYGKPVHVSSSSSSSLHCY